MTAQTMSPRIISSLELKTLDSIKALSPGLTVDKLADHVCRHTLVQLRCFLFRKHYTLYRRWFWLASRELQMLISKKLDPQFHKINFVEKFFYFSFWNKLCVCVFFLKNERTKERKRKNKEIKKRRENNNQIFCPPLMCTTVLLHVRVIWFLSHCVVFSI